MPPVSTVEANNSNRRGSFGLFRAYLSSHEGLSLLTEEEQVFADTRSLLRRSDAGTGRVTSRDINNYNSNDFIF